MAKKRTQPPNKQGQDDVLLTKEQVYSVVDFARSLSGADGFFGFYTPQLLNQNLLALGVTEKSPTYEKALKALDNAKMQAKDLQGYSEWAEYNSMLYTRLLRYYANMLSFDLKVICKNASGDDYKSQEYLEDKKRVYKFLDNFDYIGEFTKVVAHCVKNETYFTWLRTNKGSFSDTLNDDTEKVEKLTKYTLQQMPQDYCIITGAFEDGGLLYDFDMNYFLQAGVDINGYDPSFKKKFREAFVKGDDGSYIPTAPFSNRNGIFAYWVQTSPAEGSWVFKLDSTNFANVPFLAPILPNILTDREILALQKNKDIASAYGLLVGEMELLDKQKSGQVKDAFAINPKTLGQMMQIVQRGMKASINVAAMPTRNTDFYQFEDKNPDMYETQVSSTSGLGASASNMIFSSGKLSQEEARNAIINDGNFIKTMYSQFNHFLEFYINKKTRKYKFTFSFEGLNFPFEQEYRQKKVTDLAGVGIVLPQAISAAYGYKPQDFDRMMEEAANGTFTDNLVQLLSIHTASQNQGGRPQQAETKSNTREYDDTPSE